MKPFPERTGDFDPVDSRQVQPRRGDRLNPIGKLDQRHGRTGDPYFRIVGLEVLKNGQRKNAVANGARPDQ